VPFFDVASRFNTGRSFTYLKYDIEGITYDSVFKIITFENDDSLFMDYYSLYSVTKGLLEIKFPGGNTFSRVP
jgi:hypothetical protein